MDLGAPNGLQGFIDTFPIEAITDRRAVALLKAATDYQRLSIADRSVRCPYYMNYDKLYEGTPYYRYVPRGGKRSPQEIIDFVLAEAQIRNIDLYTYSAQQIRDFIFEVGSGVDCSGYVYLLLKEAFEKSAGESLENYVVKPDNPSLGGVTKICGKDLINSCNAFQIAGIKEAEPGDVISIAGGKHVICIISKIGEMILCGHSTNVILSWGPNVFPIQIVDSTKSIYDQLWSETDWIGQPYMKSTYPRLLPTDGIYRLHCFERFV